MSSELIFKKLEQIRELLGELERLLAVSAEDFQKDVMRVRAAERNFQLLVDIASDINTQILLEQGKKTPDTYRQSFSDLEKNSILASALVRQLIVSAGLRNILVHEYDIDEDYAKFYGAAKSCVPAYHEYLTRIYEYVKTRPA